MKTVTRAALALLPFASAVISQNSSSFTDPENGIQFQSYTSSADNITIGFLFPPVDCADDISTEFVGEIIAPVTAGWVGLALGGSMINNPLIVAWLNDGEIVRSTRNASSHTLPTIYEGPVITDLPYTTINDTHWKWVFRCQGCTTWEGGNLTTDGVSTLAFAYSTAPVTTPAEANSTFHKHTDHGSWSLVTSKAHSYDYLAVIAGLYFPLW